MFESLAHYGKPTTDRVKKRYSKILETRPCIDSQRAILFTEYLRDHWEEPLYLRTAGAFRHVLSHLSPMIWEDELIVGSTSRFVKGAQVYPEHFEQFFKCITTSSGGATSETKHRLRHGNALLSCVLSPEEMSKLKQAAVFWQDKNWCSLCTKHLQDTFRVFENDDARRHGFNSLFFPPQAPRGWIVIDYQMILEEGLDVIIQHLKECITSLETTAEQDCQEKIFFYTGLILSLQGIITFAEKYAREAERLAGQCKGKIRAQELYEIARICRKVPRKSPGTFREALQSFWFVHICLCLELNGRGISPGRFDQYMNPFFENDLHSGELSVTQALELLELLRVKCEQIIIAKPTDKGDFESAAMYQHITLAGSDERDNPSDTILSKFMLQSRIHIHTQQPILAVRWRDDLSDFFKRKVVDCIKTVGWCPDIYHDKTGTQRFAEQAKTRVQDYQNWVVCRNRTLNNGKMPAAINALFKTHHTMIFDLLVKDGLFSPGENALLENASRGKSFNKIVREYSGIIHRTVRKKHLKLGDVFLSYNNTGLVHPFLPALEKTIDGDSGLYRNLPSYSSDELIIAYGMIDLAKTLSIIKKYVYDEAIFTVSEIRDVIASDFEGSETMRHKLLKASSQSKQSPFFEEVLIELLDTWSALRDKANGKTRNSSQRRFNLVKRLPGTAERTHPL